MTILLTARDLHKAYGERILFDSLNLVISSGQKIGLIGPNGAGKSTLLKILMGLDSKDDGEIIPSRSLKMNYLPQTPSFENLHTVEEALKHRLTGLEDWDVNQRIADVFWKHGLEETELQLQRKISDLSGGWKKRLAILKELIAEPDLLLMDEPTNHLDVEGIFWLEDLVRNSKIAFLTITHDRYFLDQVANRILELDKRNEGGILSVDGNYSRYLEVKSAMMEAQENRENILRGVLRRETEWLRAGVKARTTKQQARIQRQSDLKTEVAGLAKRNVKQKLEIDFQSSGDKPKRLVDAKQISKSYSETPLFERFDLTLTPGTRVGILGENGSGKSSLIRVLLKEEKPDSGSIFHTDLLKVAYFEQGKENLDPELSLIQSVCPYGDQVFYRGRHIHVRSYLQRFLFDHDKMDLNVGSLSGGEQSRIVLARLMLIEANLLVLDEPTNDLDIATLNVLEDCLKEFEGAVLLVTHDRFFLDRVSTELIAFPPKDSELQPRELPGFASFDQWKEWHKSIQSEPVRSPRSSQKEKKPAAGSSQKEQAKIMKKIEKREAEYKELEEKCSAPEIASNADKLSEFGERMCEIQVELEELYSNWEALEGS